jgi:hypothetical protein
MKKNLLTAALALGLAGTSVAQSPAPARSALPPVGSAAPVTAQRPTAPVTVIRSITPAPVNSCVEPTVCTNSACNCCCEEDPRVWVGAEFLLSCSGGCRTRRCRCRW